MKNTINTRKPNLLKRMITGVKGAWSSYSRAVDMAYNRCLTYEDKVEAELCGCGSTKTSLKPNDRPIKASAFDDYSSYY